MRRAVSALLLLLLSSASCAKPVDLKASLELSDVSSGWFDAGIVAGRNKVVPNVSFRLVKKGGADVDRISLNALFRAADGKESELDNDVFLQRVTFEGDRTPPITVRAENGYTADPPQSRADMLKHSMFRDMRVQVFVKQGASQWVDLGWIDVQRTVISQ